MTDSEFLQRRSGPSIESCRIMGSDLKRFLTPFPNPISDDGSTWHTFGIGLTKPELEIDPKLFKDLTDVKIKGIVSDPFNK